MDLVSLRSLLKLAIGNDIDHLYIFGDSMFVTKWMNNQHNIHSISLLPLTSHLNKIVGLFTNLSFIHVYRDLNQVVDALSKEALQL